MKNNSKASTVAGVNTTAGTDNVSQTINRLLAALSAHSGWKTPGTAALEKSIFTSKSALLDNFLSIRINAYIFDVREQLCSKLANVGFEVVVTESQCTVEWFTLHTFHLSSTMALICQK